IRDVRIKLGVEKSELAQSLGISINQLEKYEQGADPFKASIVYEIADYLGLSITSLLPKNAPRNLPTMTLH
ncbi:helix-turn-helix transcriptional regulator, partial [Candidatus Woesearchaeota archaeon]|nr:helix-turn-helix transcriptional regulator [Candidatus Woesearchaeota archaeon]